MLQTARDSEHAMDFEPEPCLGGHAFSADRENPAARMQAMTNALCGAPLRVDGGIADHIDGLVAAHDGGRGFRGDRGGRARRPCRHFANAMKDEFDRAGPVLHPLLHHTQALITRMSQTALCNRHHSLDQQSCRWLLPSLDRLHGIEPMMAQELIANRLGVRREGVTEAALKPQKAGMIRCAPGHITVLHRRPSRERACECRAAVNKEHDRLFPDKLAK